MHTNTIMFLCEALSVVIESVNLFVHNGVNVILVSGMFDKAQSFHFEVDH